jgi:hypothetical protein
VEREDIRLGRAEVVEANEPIEDEELWTGEEDGEHLGWFCVRTDPFPCPAPECTFVAVFMTAAHLVLVWEERDDPNYGPSASYYAWEAAGRPVHGIRRSK